MRPEGIAVDPSTGLIAVGLGSPASVALLDRAGRLITTVPLPSPARHLRFAAPGGPLVAPAEKAGRVVLVSVPDGTIETSIPVGRQPHDAAAVGSRIFVGNEFSDSTSVIEGGRVSHTLRTPGQPGGLGSSSGEVAVIGVRTIATRARAGPGGTGAGRLSSILWEFGGSARVHSA
jgi:DNA-binding beta-propeller fold protein YncE